MHAFHGTLCVSNGPTFLVLVALIKSNKVHFDGNGHNQAVNAKKKKKRKKKQIPNWRTKRVTPNGRTNAV